MQWFVQRPPAFARTTTRAQIAKNSEASPRPPCNALRGLSLPLQIFSFKANEIRTRIVAANIESHHLAVNLSKIQIRDDELLNAAWGILLRPEDTFRDRRKQ